MPATMNFIPRFIAVAAFTLLAACSGGVETVQNPNTGAGLVINNGPPAANADVRAFEISMWNNLKADNRCGRCHGNSQQGTGQSPTFADDSDVNIAYAQAVPLVDLQDPASSLIVTKVGSGHNCWEAVASVCADSIEQMIINWSGGSGDPTTARAIQLTAPAIRDPGTSKNYPPGATDNGSDSFANTVYPLLTANCVNCHFEEGVSQQQAPFFANPDDVESAYDAARSKMNIDLPANSRFVARLLEGHNCWTDCADDADTMELAITQFASAIQPDVIDPLLVTSKALILQDDGIVASGGNRHEANLIGLWEFKVGSGLTAFDTSGIDPPVNLNLTGSVRFLGSYGLEFTGGKAQADTSASKKLHDFIKSSGEYSVEAWVLPANVTQEDSNIISYDSGPNNRNFTLSQTMYNYNYFNRSDQSGANGDPFMSTEDAGEILQSSLQHVVITYDPIEGRKVFVNGAQINVTDPTTGSTSIANWNDTYAFVLGGNSGVGQSWLGQLRMVAVHNRALTLAQIQQNFEVGVGQKFYLLFSVSDHIGVPDSYIRFEVSQFDDFSYLFLEPTFVNLDPDWIPPANGFVVRNMRIGINGREAVAGQTFANMDQTIDSRYDAVAGGQQLSPSGAVIALEKGADSDEFFLTFEVLHNSQHAFADVVPAAAAPPANPVTHIGEVSDIGVRTFEEINHAIASITGIPVDNNQVDSVYDQYRQQLPTVETIDAFLSSHQMAIAQLALVSCSERVNADSALPSGQRVMFTNVDFAEPANTAFNTPTKLANAIDPVLNAVLRSGLTTQPNQAELADLLGSPVDQTLDTGTVVLPYASLVTEMTQCPQAPTNPNDPSTGHPHYNPDFPCNETTDINTTARTAEIVKAICAAAVGSAAMLIQ